MYYLGFLKAETKDFLHEDVLPTHHELSIFKQCRCIPADFIQAMYNALEGSALQWGDQALITSGEFEGHVCIVKVIIQLNMEVHVLELEKSVMVDWDLLCWDFQIRDQVQVISRPNSSFAGWVTSVGGDIIKLYNDRTHKEVFGMLCNICPMFSSLSRLMCQFVMLTSGAWISFLTKIGRSK
jgi:transcription elongation factor